MYVTDIVFLALRLEHNWNSGTGTGTGIDSVLDPDPARLLCIVFYGFPSRH